MDAAQELAAGSIAELMRRFVAHVRRRGAASTADSYGFWCRSLLNHLEARTVILVDQLREEDLEEWQDGLQNRQLAPKSRALAATAVRSWLRWLVERDLGDWRLIRAVTSVRTPRGRARPIPQEELIQVLAFLGPRRPQMSLRELRERALFFYVLATGARISEALQVPRDDFDDTYVVQKGGEEKRLRVPQTVRAMVEDYLAARTDSSPWLWVTFEKGRPPRRLTRAAANQGWRRMAIALGLARWSSHRLRDSSATWLALKRLPTHMIADHLGHSNLQTVMKYIKIAEEQRGDVLAAIEELVQQVPRRPLRRGVKLRGRPDRRPGR